MIWDKEGNPTEIPALKGAVAVIPTTITNHGDVVGNIIYADAGPHVFLWTRQGGMRDLGTPDGDFLSVAPCCRTAHERGDIVAFSCPGPLRTCRAVLYTNNKWYDLNALTLPGSAYLTFVAGINDEGQIAAGGPSSTGDTRSYLVSPTQTQALILGPDHDTTVSKSLQLDGTQSTSADGKALTYLWSIPRGYRSAAITGGNPANPTVTFSSRGEPTKFSSP